MAAENTRDTIEPAGFTPLQEPGKAPSPAPRKGRYLIGAAALAFVLALSFLFSARSLQVTAIAETPAAISIDGLALPLGERFLLRPGQYTVHASAQGYVELSTEVTVDNRDSQSVELTLQPLPGRLTVYSQPPGASVFLDGVAAGSTPLEDFQVDSGDHIVRLEHPHHLPLEQPLSITGRAVRQQLDLELAPAWAEVSIASSPAGAAVIVDGETLGATPGVFDIDEGHRSLRLELAGFAPHERDINVIAGQSQALGEIVLSPAAGTLELTSEPSGASVLLDGEFRGHTPLNLALDPTREHTLDIFKPGYRRYSEQLSLGSGDRGSRTVTLKPELGQVQFELSPSNAQLFVDGSSRGKGSQTLSLTAVPHDIEVRLAGYATVRRKVTPRPGLPQQVRVQLLTEKQARMARIPPSITTSLGQTLLLFNPADSALPEFTMGTSRRESGRRSNEVLRPVALKRMFYLQTTEVSNAQFRQFQPNHDSGHAGGTSLDRDSQPVVQVTWQQAASFCNWLSAREGLPPFYTEEQGIIMGFDASATGYRLPTEAEWAWAARANGTELQKFPWLGRFPPTLAVENYADSKSAYITGRVLDNYDDGHVVTAKVGSFGPNQNGLFDMGGNVAEWVHDRYGIPAPDSPRQTDPTGPEQGDNHVIRGASWTQSRLTQLRLTHRDYGQAGRDDVGFRLARYAE